MRKKRKTLKKKIRRIINITLFFTFLIVAIVNILIAYHIIINGTYFAANILGRTCAALVDGDELKFINSSKDIHHPIYIRIRERIKNSFPELWNLDYIHLVIIKEIDGKTVGIIDNKGDVFRYYYISPEVLKNIYSTSFKTYIVGNSSSPFDNIALTPIKDSNQKTVGILALELSRGFQVIIFIGIVLSIVFLSIIGFIISLVVTRIMTMRITKPLEILNQKIRMIARAEADLSQRVIFENTYKEVEELAEATNMVMESTGHFVRLLEEKQYRLEEKNRQLAQQAEELEAQTEELMALNENLEETMRELKDTQVQLVQSEKMAALGQLTAGVAHEINTPLGAINSNTEIIDMVIKFLKADLDKNASDKLLVMIKKLDKANNTNKLACDRIIQIVRHLKNFARLDESEFKEANINEGIESVLILSHNLLKHRITVHKEFGKIPPVKCFPNQLNQVFMNIIVNAAQAIKDKGDIWIKTWAEKDKAFVQVKDNGEGIAKENLSKIFDPGFTTKGVGVGTGLGLSICYKIIEKHNGKIYVESEPSKGAIFTVEIPINNTYEDVKKKCDRC